MNATLPIAAARLFVVLALVAMRQPERRPKWRWLLPAALSAGLLVFSLFAVGVEGPFGFRPEHTRNLWGNQIWFDLLLAVGIAWFLIVPPARKVRMRLPLKLLLFVTTGCIGFRARLARLLYLQSRPDRNHAKNEK